MVTAPAQAKRGSPQRGSLLLHTSMGPLQTRPVALPIQKLEFGAWQGSGLGTVLQGAISQGRDYCGSLG